MQTKIEAEIEQKQEEYQRVQDRRSKLEVQALRRLGSGIMTIEEMLELSKAIVDEKIKINSIVKEIDKLNLLKSAGVSE
jgi:hypothetical protein